MASPKRRLPTNVDGDFYVDETCIDCGTCRWMAPETFNRASGHARVHAQPAGDAATERALLALVSCPVAAIGTESRHDIAEASARFPRHVAEGVFHCGFHHRDSYGAASYLIVRPEGNVLVDSPRFAGPLVRSIEALGGVATMFLTHCDDVADHARFAEHFGCERVIHEADVRAGTRDVERLVAGVEPVALAPDLTILPTPGHTRGSACLLYDERVLFTGDHLAYDLRASRLYAFKDACWYDWATQRRSMRALMAHRFEHVLPGHGAPFSAPPETMNAELERCVAWMA